MHVCNQNCHFQNLLQWASAGNSHIMGLRISNDTQCHIQALHYIVECTTSTKVCLNSSPTPSFTASREGAFVREFARRREGSSILPHSSGIFNSSSTWWSKCNLWRYWCTDSKGNVWCSADMTILFKRLLLQTNVTWTVANVGCADKHPHWEGVMCWHTPSDA